MSQHYGITAAPVDSSYPSHQDAMSLLCDECPSDSSSRTIWGILWNCLATTFAVTWVTVHSNVPFLEESSWSILKRRVFLMVLALLAPEVMIMWAFKQWRGAVMIKEMVNKAKPESIPKWTMKHGYLLQMGGFKIVCTDEERIEMGKVGRYKERLLSHGYWYRSRVGNDLWEGVMDFRRLRRLLREHRIDFPATTVEEIDDRSKGDSLSKFIALFQITWFILQLLARHVQGLTVTQLEFTTAALAGLNSVMYLFWWNKPLDVRCSIIIHTKGVLKILAERPMDDQRWTFGDPDDFRLRDYLRMFATPLYQSGWSIVELLFRFLMSFTFRCIHDGATLDTGHKPSENHENPHSPNSRDTSLLPVRLSTIQHNDTEHNTERTKRLFKTLYISLKSIAKKMFVLPQLLMFTPMYSILQPGTVRFRREQYSDAREKIHNKPSLKLLFDEDDMEWIMAMIFYCEEAEAKPHLYSSATAGAVFGSIHCAAWNSVFPSVAEKIMWRTSSLSLVGVCISIFPGALIQCWAEPYYYAAKNGSIAKCLWKYLGLEQNISFIPALIYPISRLALLILALLSLRSLRDTNSALQAVEWVDFIPHI